MRANALPLDERADYRRRVAFAFTVAQEALEEAKRLGRRTDCLRCAASDLLGALANIDAEDAEAAAAARKGAP